MTTRINLSLSDNEYETIRSRWESYMKTAGEDLQLTTYVKRMVFYALNEGKTI